MKKKKNINKLSLATETIVRLDETLRGIAGGCRPVTTNSTITGDPYGDCCADF